MNNTATAQNLITESELVETLTTRDELEDFLVQHAGS